MLSFVIFSHFAWKKYVDDVIIQIEESQVKNRIIITSNFNIYRIRYLTKIVVTMENV